jgi:hypothetical protein
MGRRWKMKVMKNVLSISVILVMVASCATTMGTLPEKYNLDNELESVDQITSFRVSSWDQADKQTIILKADWNDYFLLVLDQPMDRMVSGLSIGISSNVLSITPGFDRIIIKDSPFTEYYVIEKIYKLKGKEQAEKIKERLREQID